MELENVKGAVLNRESVVNTEVQNQMRSHVEGLGEDELKLCHCFPGGKVSLGTENPVLSVRPWGGLHAANATPSHLLEPAWTSLPIDSPIIRPQSLDLSPGQTHPEFLFLCIDLYILVPPTTSIAEPWKSPCQPHPRCPAPPCR